MSDTATEIAHADAGGIVDGHRSRRLALVVGSPVPSPTGCYARAGKRSLDLVVALSAFVALAPILALTWLTLRCTVGRGVVLRQRRIGRHGDEFCLLKFRTMHHCRRSSDEYDDWRGDDRRETHKSDDDPRHTRVGRIVRKFSLDELPQLFNVVRGDMSVVGPRPELASAAASSFRAHSRHLVRPGLTGPFQVSDLRRSGDLRRGLALDTDYVQQLSLRNDVGYLLRTVRCLVRGTGS